MQRAFNRRWIFLAFILSLPLALAVQARAQSNTSTQPPAAATPQPAPQQLAGGPTEKRASGVEPANSNAAADTPPVEKPEGVGEEPKPSEAERIARLNRRLETDRERLAEMQAQLSDPQSAYVEAEKDFQRLDLELEKLKKTIDELKAGGQAAAAAALAPELEELEKQWKLAEQRFGLEIEERKAVQEQIATLQQKLAKDQEVLDKLRGVPADRPAEEPKPSAASSNDAKPAATTAAAATDAPPSKPAEAQPAAPAVPSLLGASPAISEASLVGGAAEEPKEDSAPSKEVQAASDDAKAKEAVAQEAEEEVKSISDRIGILSESVSVARSLVATTRKKMDNADETVRSLDEEFCEQLASGASQQELEQLRARLSEAQQRLQDARVESRQRVDRLDELQTELATLQMEQIEALQAAELLRHEAEVARERLDELQNPFAPRNLLEWLLDHAPKILSILLAMAGLVSLSRMGENRLVDLMARRGIRGSVEDRENRAKTLVGVFRNAASMLIITGGVLMIADELGIPVGPLMGGAAVVGLAVAFGAQSLIKDFFTGFMILLEQQFMVNDVVRIGDISGQVERITLRMTVLRDLEGSVHFIPHGQITSTTNMTHGWSRAVFDIAVAYKEDIDRVMEVLLEVGRQLRRDPEFGPLILEDPVMLGVDNLADSAVVIKFFFKTRPLRQWPVKREMLRRIKRRFDELNIEIPFPHRTVYHHHEALGLETGSDWSSKNVA